MGTRYTVPTSPEWWGRDLDWWSAHDLAEVARDLLAGHCMRQIIFPVIELVPDRDSWANRPSGDRELIEMLDRISHPSATERVFTSHDVVFALQMITDELSRAAAQEKVGSNSHYSMSEVVQLWRLDRQWRRDLWVAQV